MSKFEIKIEKNNWFESNKQKSIIYEYNEATFKRLL